MRYFLIFDDVSDPGGDVYRWDGHHLQMQLKSGKYSDWMDYPSPDETLEELLTALVGGGRWEEINEPA